MSKHYFVTVDRFQELQDFGAGKINESLAHTQAVSNAQLQQSHVVIFTEHESYIMISKKMVGIYWNFKYITLMERNSIF